MSDKPNGADFGIDMLGVKANVKNIRSLNTVATVVTMILTATLLYVIVTHSIQAKDDDKELVRALRDSNKEVAKAIMEISSEHNTSMRQLSQSIKMQNCLTIRIRPDMTPQQRADEQEFCKRITQ